MNQVFLWDEMVHIGIIWNFMGKGNKKVSDKGIFFTPFD
jgi:hypothetical protein